MSQSSGETDWLEWHRPYDVDGSALHTRLRLVQARLRAALDACAPGPIRLISACAGQGRDVVPVLAGHPRRVDVRARLVELDPRNADIARAAIEASALSLVEVVTGDALNTSAYEGMVPADIVLFCGIWGNVTDADVARSIELLPMLCARGATVLWTRHRFEPDLTGPIRQWLADQRFEEIGFDAPAESTATVGAHRFVGRSLDYKPGVRMFTFVAATA